MFFYHFWTEWFVYMYFEGSSEWSVVRKVVWSVFSVTSPPNHRKPGEAEAGWQC